MLTIEQRTMEPEVTVLQIQGRITLGRYAQELEWKCEEVLTAQVKRLVFDVSGVTFLDSTGVGIIVMSAGKLKNFGGSLRICGAQSVVQQTLQLCRVAEIAPMYATIEEAAASFRTASSAA